MANTDLLDRLDAAIAAKNLLRHPFYQDWQAGKLTRQALQLYAAQYYRHVEAFPKHLRVLAARTEGPLRDTVMENLAEEEDFNAPHPKLWRDFAAAVGVGEDDITCCPALPGTQNVVATFREICGDRPVAEAVGALYAYEAQVPEIASTKIDIDGYGVDVDGSGSISVSGSNALDYRGMAQITTKQGFFTNTFGRLSGGKLVDGKLTFPFRISGTIQNPVFAKVDDDE